MGANLKTRRVLRTAVTSNVVRSGREVIRFGGRRSHVRDGVKSMAQEMQPPGDALEPLQSIRPVTVVTL